MTDETTTEAPAEAQAATEAPVKGTEDELNARRTANLDQTAKEGVLHDDGLLDRKADDYVGPVPVDQAAPEGVDTDPASSVQGNPEYVPDLPATMAEQKAPRFDKAAPEYRQGYVGTLPTDADGNREDLTLQAAAERARADYGDGRPTEDA